VIYRHILFPVDFSEQSKAVAPFVLSMARRFHASVTLMHVIEPSMMLCSGTMPPVVVTVDYDGAKIDAARALASFASEELPKTDVTCIVEIGGAVSTITEWADGTRADLIAIPTHGCGLFRRMLVGSTAARVLHDATVPVWTSAHAAEPSHRAHPQPRTIVAAIDLGPESQHVLSTALELARDAAAQVQVLHLAPEGQSDAQAADRRCRDLLNELSKDDMTTECGDTGVGIEIAQAGEAVGDVVRRVALASRADLVVIGHGNIRKGVFSRLRANAWEIVRDAPCPVLSV
jgi:nucleotide-binding universal stress UspA family protein